MLAFCRRTVYNELRKNIVSHIKLRKKQGNKVSLVWNTERPPILKAYLGFLCTWIGKMFFAVQSKNSLQILYVFQEF